MPPKKTISLEISSFAALNSQVFCSIWQQTLRWFRLRQLPITYFDMDLDNSSQKWQYNVNIWTLTYILIKYWHFKFVLIFVSAWWLNFMTFLLFAFTIRKKRYISCKLHHLNFFIFFKVVAFTVDICVHIWLYLNILLCHHLWSTIQMSLFFLRSEWVQLTLSDARFSENFNKVLFF